MNDRSSRGTTRTVLVTLAVVGVVGGAGYFGWQKIGPSVFMREMKTSEVTVISPSQAEVLVTATGYVIPQRTSKVGPKIPGRLAKVLIKEGDVVKEGDVIAQLDDADAKTQVVAASSRVGANEARIATARAQVAEVSQQIARERALVASGAAGHAQLDDLTAREAALKEAVGATVADTRASQAEVGTFGVELKDRMIFAPISGRVVSKPATVGELVGGGNLATVAEIVDFGSLMVETDVPEARLQLVKLGGPCEIVLDAYPNKRYRGIAKDLGLQASRQKGTIVVKVAFTDDITGVLPEMSARVGFLSKAITDQALAETPKKVVPAESVVDRGGQTVVFIVDSGKLHAAPVRVGQRVGASVELLDGPPPGTKIVTTPASDTMDGQRIKETEK